MADSRWGEEKGNVDKAGCDSDDLETTPKRQRKDKDGEVGDPLVVVGPDILEKIFSFLDAHSVARCLVVSHRWHDVATSDLLWAPRLSELWTGKAHIPRCSQIRGLSRLRAYSLSVMDGKRVSIIVSVIYLVHFILTNTCGHHGTLCTARTNCCVRVLILGFEFRVQIEVLSWNGAELRADMLEVSITREDLCDHVWEYRFKATAPEYWRNLDPSWKNTGRSMWRYFHPDGTHTADPSDKAWGGHESNYSIITSYVGDGRIRQHYVRINRWAPMTVSRREDWSWEMSNDIYFYSSLPGAGKPGGTGPLFPHFSLFGKITGA